MSDTSGRSTSSRVARRRNLAILFCDLSDSTTLTCYKKTYTAASGNVIFKGNGGTMLLAVSQ